MVDGISDADRLLADKGSESAFYLEPCTIVVHMAPALGVPDTTRISAALCNPQNLNV